ncbi:MAG: hypothetical protein ACLS61_06270 [Ruminococcus sp.]
MPEPITEMPPTDANGVSSVTIDKTQDVVYLKEITESLWLPCGCYRPRRVTCDGKQSYTGAV